MSLANRVRNILQTKPYCRDNDMSLCTEVWNAECEYLGLDFTTMATPVFLHLISEGKLSKQQSILRSRRKAFQDYPHLKGSSYKAKTRTKSEHMKNKPLPNLIKKSGLDKFNPDLLHPRNSHLHQFPRKHPASPNNPINQFSLTRRVATKC